MIKKTQLCGIDNNQRTISGSNQSIRAKKWQLQKKLFKEMSGLIFHRTVKAETNVELIITK